MTSKNSGGIVIYSTKGDIMFSSTGEITGHKKPPRKHRSQRNIAHKIFEDMRAFNKEEFWDNVLIKFSRNVFLNDFRFIGKTLFYKFKSKNHKEEITLDENDLENSLGELKNFLKRKGILPVEEIVDDSSELFVPRKLITCWKEIGKNKSILIFNYLKLLEEKYSLDYLEMKRTESLLKVLIFSNILGNDHIILENEEIKEIKYLEWSEEKRAFDFNINPIKIKPLKKEKKNEDNYYIINSYSDDKNNLNKEIQICPIDKKWEKFLENYYKIK